MILLLFLDLEPVIQILGPAQPLVTQIPALIPLHSLATWIPTSTLVHLQATQTLTLSPNQEAPLYPMGMSQGSSQTQLRTTPGQATILAMGLPAQHLQTQSATLQGVPTTDRLGVLLKAHPAAAVPPKMVKSTMKRTLHLPIPLTVLLQALSLCPEAQTKVLDLILVPKTQALAQWTILEAHPPVPIKKHRINLHLSPTLYQRPRTLARRPLLAILVYLVKQVLKKKPARTARIALLPDLALVLQRTLPLNRLPEVKATQETAPLVPTTQLAVISTKDLLELQ